MMAQTCNGLCIRFKRMSFPSNLKYKINKIVGQYHSGLEHTFLWILDAEDPHLIQQFAVESGMASFNEVKIVPLETFEGVAEGAKKIHGL